VTGGLKERQLGCQGDGYGVDHRSNRLHDQGSLWLSSTKAGTTYTGSGWFSGPNGTVLPLRLRHCNGAGTSFPAFSNVAVTLPISGWVNASDAYTARSAGNALRTAVYGKVPAKGTALVDSLSLTAPGS